MESFFHTTIYVPLYNLLVFLVDVLPGGDLGLAVIVTTIIVKFILLPLSLSAARTQRAMKGLEPQLKEIKEKYKDDKETQAREMFALYKQHNVKPFASILMLFVQIPILFGLYYVSQHSTGLATPDLSILYPFIEAPVAFTSIFLGIFPLAGTSVVLAFIAALTQFLQSWYLIPIPPKSTSATPSMQEELGRTVAIQARFVFPLLIGVIAYTSGVLALYFAASSLFMIAQEFVVRKINPTPATVTA